MVENAEVVFTSLGQEVFACAGALQGLDDDVGDTATPETGTMTGPGQRRYRDSRPRHMELGHGGGR